MVDLTITVRKTPGTPAGQTTYEYTGLTGILPMVADAVWDEPIAGHLNPVQFGGYFQATLKRMPQTVENAHTGFMNFLVANNQYTAHALNGTIPNLTYSGHIKFYFMGGPVYIVRRFEDILGVVRLLDWDVVDAQAGDQQREYSFDQTQQVYYTLESNVMAIGVPGVAQWTIGYDSKGA